MKKSKKFSGVDPQYFEKQKEALRRKHRKTILFNDQELSAIDEYCRRFKISSRSGMIRQAVMERILSDLSDSHPTLF